MRGGKGTFSKLKRILDQNSVHTYTEASVVLFSSPGVP